jgi:hypothetical protein
MTTDVYNLLWHYSEQFTRDPLARSELITMAWREGEKLGDRCSVKLMQSLMHFRSKELKIRSAFPADEVGKSQRDAWNKERISINQPYPGEPECTLADTLSSYTSPLDLCIVNDFFESCNDSERALAEAKLAGYSDVECLQLMNMQRPQFERLKLAVREKAVEYLV